MLLNVNMSNDPYDVGRFANTEDFEGFLGPLNGVELFVLDEQHNEAFKKIIPLKYVNGLHTYFPAIWYAFWTGNEAELLDEFGTYDAVEQYYGSLNPSSLVERLRANLHTACSFGAHYVVIHACECTATELLSFRYKHSSEEVLEAFCDIVKQSLEGFTEPLDFMFENLWYPGLMLTEPSLASEFIYEVERYVHRDSGQNPGFMLDTGHLLHTNFDIANQQEGLSYINSCLDKLDAYDGLCSYIKGMHLNQSITGAYCKDCYLHPSPLDADFSKRLMQSNIHAFTMDKHQPFSEEGIAELIARLPLDYLTFEFITESRSQLEEYISIQMKALGMR